MTVNEMRLPWCWSAVSTRKFGFRIDALEKPRWIRRNIHTQLMYDVRMKEGAQEGVKSHIAKWGSSLAVLIPKPVAEQWGVQEGSPIEIVPHGDQVVLRKKVCNLEDMLAQVTPQNVHSEWDIGVPRGREEF